MPTQLKTAQTKSFADTAQEEVSQRVRGIIADIRHRGEAAVREYAETFDRWAPTSFRLSEEEVAAIIATLPQQVIDDIVFVQAQVRRFAQAQRDSMTDIEIETLPGVRLGHRHVPGPGRRLLHPGRQVPADRVRAHDDRHRQGRRRPAGGRLHPADQGRDPRRHGGGDEPGRRRRDLHPRRRPGRRVDGARHRVHGARST